MDVTINASCLYCHKPGAYDEDDIARCEDCRKTHPPGPPVFDGWVLYECTDPTNHREPKQWFVRETDLTMVGELTETEVPHPEERLHCPFCECLSDPKEEG